MAISFFEDDPELRRHVEHYAALLGIAAEPMMITSSKARFEEWLGRRIGYSLGGAYIHSRRMKHHLILVNRPRLNPAEPRAVELVVAEELIHLRDWVVGDRRRHAKHGYDRIAVEVSRVTGASLEEIRNCLVPREARPYKWLYACPGCGITIKRRRKGTWSCARCSPRFDKRFVLRLVQELKPA